MPCIFPKPNRKHKKLCNLFISKKQIAINVRKNNYLPAGVSTHHISGGPGHWLAQESY